MSLPQSAITPEAEPFALYTQLKVNQNAQQVLEALQKLPALVEELNETQPGAQLTLSVAFSHAFWSQLEQSMPSELKPFPELGEGDIFAPSSDVDVLVHCHSNRHDLHFYLLRKLMGQIAEDVTIVDETQGFRFMDSRDMTDFVDGTENPRGEQRAEVALVADGEFAGGSYVMVQRFEHNLPAWNRLNVSAQEKVVGRTKPDSIELEDVPAASHVGRVDIKEEGKGLKIVRHSLPYGTVSALTVCCLLHTVIQYITSTRCLKACMALQMAKPINYCASLKPSLVVTSLRLRRQCLRP
ncbi:predicted dye-decolorizing peroxidase (DyP) YfeX-like subgroup [Vibrio maritimus]|uniref:Predicted dye-decolorizing peroxidase (DyP) YfeX-like subgroup n=1 Tax=Vibrio maritimus TaxID=990268 RepID=A0A090SK88_9VIBR|nr:predicted dye-decolorizing peroxidase (DyP) YfeX-like subgroup [Vibrio maritimus]